MESQNNFGKHKITLVAKVLWKSCSPTSRILTAGVTVDKFAMGLVQSGFEDHQDGGSTASGQPAPACNHSGGEKLIPCVQLQSLPLHLVAAAPCPFLVHPWKNHVSFSAMHSKVREDCSLLP